MATEKSTISIEFSEDERDEAIEFYKSRLIKFEAEVEKAKAMLRKFGFTDFNQESTIQSESKDQYRENWNWTLKIKYVLKITGHCLTTREIINKIIELEPVLKSEGIINSVSGTISSKSSKKIIFNRYQAYQGSEYYVGLKEWFDSYGKILDEYKGDF